MNNLSDFDHATNAVAYKDLPEIDRWALHHLQIEIREALAAYEAYQFPRVISRLVNFCGTELSSFYLDVVKDRLYCDPADSQSRRSAQTVLYRVADSLLRLLAPVLSFTTDESWRFMGHSQAVSLSDLPISDSTVMDEKLSEDWKVLLSLRDSVLGEIEKARAAGTMKAPREAVAHIRLKDKDLAAFFKKYETHLSTIFGISRVTLSVDASVDVMQIAIQKRGRRQMRALLDF